MLLVNKNLNFLLHMKENDGSPGNIQPRVKRQTTNRFPEAPGGPGGTINRGPVLQRRLACPPYPVVSLSAELLQVFSRFSVKVQKRPNPRNVTKVGRTPPPPTRRQQSRGTQPCHCFTLNRQVSAQPRPLRYRTIRPTPKATRLKSIM